MHMIITDPLVNDDNIMFLGWQNPIHNESGYFWTGFRTILEILDNNTKDHPFIFESEKDANKFAKRIGLHNYNIMEVDTSVLANMAPSDPDNSSQKPGIAIELVNLHISIP